LKPPSSAATKAAKVALPTLCAATLGLGLTGKLMAQSIEFDTEFTIAELMEALVMPEADVIWNAVQYLSTEDGERMVGPETDEDWLVVRHNAMALAEIANNLMIPGRAADKPGTSPPEGELSPAEIEALIDENRDAWNAYAQALRSVAIQAVDAVDARDLENLFLDTGGALDAACEACHRTFWYPDQ
jgi:cytochrome c556